jgi:hypothetical protein
MCKSFVAAAGAVPALLEAFRRGEREALTTVYFHYVDDIAAVIRNGFAIASSGARVRGAAAGATVGAIGGNDVGNAAAKGAVAGGVVRRNKNRAAAAQQNEAAAQQQQAGAASYSNARQACLEGRGYSVK